MASDTLAKIDRARAAVAELNYGAREWKGLHEPASEDATDVVIMEALRCAALEIARLTRELEEAWELWGRISEVLVRRACHDLTARDALDAVIRALALAALRSDAQGEDRWEDQVFGPIVHAYNEAYSDHPSDRSENDVG